MLVCQLPAIQILRNWMQISFWKKNVIYLSVMYPQCEIKLIYPEISKLWTIALCFHRKVML